ncbi:hypothetical protein ACWGR4_33870 [Embleya sp. NPDC055664]
MTTILRHPRPGFTWDWWAVDAEGLPVQFSRGPASEFVSAYVDRIDAATRWVEENRPAWFGGVHAPLHTFDSFDESSTYTRHAVPDSPLRPATRRRSSRTSRPWWC